MLSIPLDLSGELFVSSSSCSSPGSIHLLVDYVTGQFGLILVVPCWMEAPWLPNVLNMLTDISHQCPIIKALHHGYLGWVGVQRSAITAFNPFGLLRDVHCVDKGSLPHSFRQRWAQLKCP